MNGLSGYSCSRYDDAAVVCQCELLTAECSHFMHIIKTLCTLDIM